ncbi:MAG: Gfo/Idh/MocA family protein [Janthinobacterium lividum]
MSAPVRFGLVGYGKGGQRFHAPLIASTPGCELSAVVTTSPQRREMLAAEHPGVAVFDDLAAMASAGVVDAVAISTTADSHVPLVVEALRSGLPVVCDKPFALDSRSAAETIALADELGIPLSVYQNRRWDSDVLTVRAALDSGRLGRLQRLESHIEQYAPPKGIPDSGGGILLDLGSHVVDQALLIAGPVASVYAELDHLDASVENPVCRFELALCHVGGTRSHVVGDLALHGRPGPRFRVFGTEGTLEVPAFDGQAEILMAGGSPVSEGDAWGVVPRERWARLHVGTTTTEFESLRGDWREFYAGFAAAVRGGAPVPVDPRDSLAGLLVLEAARRSALTGEVERLEVVRGGG